MSRAAVGYLARAAEGPSPIRAFLDSYNRFSSGYPHKLYIIAKVKTSTDQLSWLVDLLRSVPHQLIPYDDDIGRDIAAYLSSSKQMDGDLLCLFNTFSLINGSDWLAKLVAAYGNPNVGLVGTSGSYESLWTDSIILNRLDVLMNEAAFDRELITNWAPLHKSAGKLLRRRYKRFLRFFQDRYYKLPSVKERLAKFPPPYKEGNPLEKLFPPFPNPHVRSNGFLCSKSYFLSFPDPEPPTSKMGGLMFESGYGGLSHKARMEGKRLLVVDRRGQTYDIEDWVQSATFRFATAENLLVTDNSTAHFYALAQPTRDIFGQLTYGGHLLGVELDPNFTKIAI
ncbi:protein of unknown function [Hyphomicrobium sp. MC1]|nr:protein of unknown function [Hyphomicrobium sp. MC1]